MEAALFSQDRLQQFQVCCRGFSDGIDADQLQLLGGLFSAPVEVIDGERPHFGRDFLRIQGVGPVRFLKVAGHLCEQFIVRDSHIDRKAKLFSDCIPDLPGQLQSSFPVFRRDPLCEVEKGLIDGHLLQERCVPGQDFHHGMGIFSIGLKIRRDQDQLGAFLQGLDNRLARLDAVFFCRNGFGRNDSVAGLDVAAHCGGDGAQIHGSGILFQAL